MSVFIIHSLEVVDVEHGDAKGLGQLQDELAGAGLDEASGNVSVVRSGQGVVNGNVFQLLLGHVMLDVQFLQEEVACGGACDNGQVQGKDDIQVGVVDNGVGAQDARDGDEAHGQHVVPGGSKAHREEQELRNDGAFAKVGLVGQKVNHPDGAPQGRKDGKVRYRNENFVVPGFPVHDDETDQQE